jgi:IS4 transposase
MSCPSGCRPAREPRPSDCSSAIRIVYETDRKLFLGNNEWHETTPIDRRKDTAEHDDHRRYSVFMSNRGSRCLSEYSYRWEIESGYKSIKRFMAATTSKDFVLRFFYSAFACLLYSIWRAVDLLVQVAVRLQRVECL